MGFLSGLQGLFDPNRLAVAQAFASGDYQGAAALRARQDELQRQRAVRDAQVIGAKNLGINPAEIDAMDTQDLSHLAQWRAARRMFDSAAGGSEDGGLLPSAAKGSPLPAQGSGAPQYASPPGMPPSDPSFASASAPFPGTPGFGGRAGQQGGLQTGPLSGGGWSQMATLGSIPRLRNLAETASLPRGSIFLAPDASLRSII
jgi:hypothetical protein